MIIGIAVSLLLHLLLLTAMHDRLPVHRDTMQPKRMTLEVFLPPFKPAPPVAPVMPDRNIPQPAEPHRPKHHAVPHKEIPAAPAPITNAPLTIHPVNKAPSRYIDPDAARAAVPDILKQLDREKMEQPVGQLLAKPLYAPDHETRLERQMAQAGRPNCLKEAGSGGLLAPLFMAMQKKGTGCKW